MSDSRFQRAVAQPFYLRLAIDGPAGSGKTFTALRVASHFADKYRQVPAFIDTERGSASKYAGVFAFDVVNLEPPYHPDRFVKGVQAAVEAGYRVVVIDSLSHAWNGVGGLLELVDAFARKYSGNSYAAWKDATPIQARLIDTLTSADCHVIACLRAKMEYTQDRDDKGRLRIEKIGLAPVQREGMEYEFDVVGDMNVAHSLAVSKTRCVELTDTICHKPGKEFAEILWRWTQGGQKDAPRPDTASVPSLTPPPENVASEADFAANIEPVPNPIQAKMMHWIDDPERARMFRRWWESELKLSLPEVLDALGVSDIHDFPGDDNGRKAAATRISEYVRRKKEGK